MVESLLQPIDVELRITRHPHHQQRSQPPPIGALGFDAGRFGRQLLGASLQCSIDLVPIIDPRILWRTAPNHPPDDRRIGRHSGVNCTGKRPGNSHAFVGRGTGILFNSVGLVEQPLFRLIPNAVFGTFFVSQYRRHSGDEAIAQNIPTTGIFRSNHAGTNNDGCRHRRGQRPADSIRNGGFPAHGPDRIVKELPTRKYSPRNTRRGLYHFPSALPAHIKTPGPEVVGHGAKGKENGNETGSVENPAGDKGTGTPARRGSADCAKVSQSPAGFSTEPNKTGNGYLINNISW